MKRAIANSVQTWSIQRELENLLWPRLGCGAQNRRHEGVVCAPFALAFNTRWARCVRASLPPQRSPGKLRSPAPDGTAMPVGHLAYSLC
jgi:hypothetical protein